MRGLWAILLALCLLAASALAETPSLPACATVEEAEALLTYPEDGQPADVAPGFIRYISQDQGKDDLFCEAYWLGGEPGSLLDLTVETASDGKAYLYHAATMCTRAVYAMALSYLGVDVTPGGMSAMLNQRDIDPPYTEITALLPQVEQAIYKRSAFRTMWESYLSDARCSPIYMYFERPNGAPHAVLLVGKREDGRYIVVDPGYHEIDGAPARVYTLSLNRNRTEILNSDFRTEQAGSRILGFCQWRLTEEAEP